MGVTSNEAGRADAPRFRHNWARLDLCPLLSHSVIVIDATAIWLPMNQSAGQHIANR